MPSDSLWESFKQVGQRPPLRPGHAVMPTSIHRTLKKYFPKEILFFRFQFPLFILGMIFVVFGSIRALRIHFEIFLAVGHGISVLALSLSLVHRKRDIALEGLKTFDFAWGQFNAFIWLLGDIFLYLRCPKRHGIGWAIPFLYVNVAFGAVLLIYTMDSFHFPHSIFMFASRLMLVLAIFFVFNGAYVYLTFCGAAREETSSTDDIECPLPSSYELSLDENYSPNICYVTLGAAFNIYFVGAKASLLLALSMKKNQYIHHVHRVGRPNSPDPSELDIDTDQRASDSGSGRSVEMHSQE